MNTTTTITQTDLPPTPQPDPAPTVGDVYRFDHEGSIRTYGNLYLLGVLLDRAPRYVLINMKTGNEWASPTHDITQVFGGVYSRADFTLVTDLELRYALKPR